VWQSINGNGFWVHGGGEWQVLDACTTRALVAATSAAGHVKPVHQRAHLLLLPPAWPALPCLLPQVCSAGVHRQPLHCDTG
jgi:hypothetical protein